MADEIRLSLNPVIVGAGLPFFPSLDAPIRLRQLETRTFASGVVLARYATNV